MAIKQAKAAKELAIKQETLLLGLHNVEHTSKKEAPWTRTGPKTNPCIGPYQISEAYFQDAQQKDKTISGTHVDCEGPEGLKLSRQVANGYLDRYAKGAWNDNDSFNAETCARIHNGGPKGAGTKKDKTDEYW